MKWLATFLIAALPVAAAVDGTVTNRTTGKPQQGATVTLYKMTQNGLEAVESVKSDASGKFQINQQLTGPNLLQTAFGGVTYNHMIPPGQPSAGLALEVFNSKAEPGEAVVSQHMVLLEATGQELRVTESFLFNNPGTTTYNDPARGTLRLFVPPGGSKSIRVTGTAPQGMPIDRAAEKTSQPNVYSVDFPIKPGETNIQLSYAMPFSGGPFEGHTYFKGGPTSLIAPLGVEIKGDGLVDRGKEPRTQATIYQVQGDSYKVDISGTGTLRPASGSEGGETAGGPEVSQVMPKVDEKRYLILAISMSILALGFVLLYRAKTPQPPAKGNP